MSGREANGALVDAFLQDYIVAASQVSKNVLSGH